MPGVLISHNFKDNLIHITLNIKSVLAHIIHNIRSVPSMLLLLIYVCSLFLLLGFILVHIALKIQLSN